MKFDLNLPSTIYSGDIDGEDLITYLYVRVFYMRMKTITTVYLHPDELSLFLYNKVVIRYEKKRILDSLRRLQDLGLIKYSPTDYKLEVVEFHDPHFVILPFSSIDKIAKSRESKRGDLCLYLLQLLSTRDNAVGVGYQKLSYLSTITGLSERTIMRYNAKLEGLGVIYVRKSNKLVKGDGYSYSDSNVYGLMEDKELVDKYADEHEYGTDSHGSNWQRKVTAKYNAYRKSPNIYKAAEVEELYKMCQEYNDLMDQLQTNRPGDEYIRKKKDLNCFNY